MLADAEDKGVVEHYVGTLGLRNVEIVPLGMRRWVECQERIRRIATGVCHGQTEGQGMRVHFVGVLCLLAYIFKTSRRDLPSGPLVQRKS
jgi:hypothetical protein